MLQIVDVIDIALPARFQHTLIDPSERKGRLLRLRLTDGNKKCVALEYGQLSHIRSDILIPGVKLKIQNVTVRLGVLLLEKKNIEVLGGRVDSLAEAWETQQLYGGAADRKPSTTAVDGTTGTAVQVSKPPPFKPYGKKDSNTGDGCDASPTKGKGKDADSFTKKKDATQETRIEKTESSSRCRSSLEPRKKNNMQQQQQHAASAPAAAAPPGLTMSMPIASVSSSRAPMTQLPHTHEQGNDKAKQLLLDKLATGTANQPSRGSIRFGRRERRGRFHDDDDDSTKMTMEEWEAMKKKGNTSMSNTTTTMRSDEEMARQLQHQLNMEDDGRDDVSSVLMGMFDYSGRQEENFVGRGSRGRGRGRGRHGDAGRGGGRRGGRDGVGDTGRGRGRGRSSGHHGRGRGRG